MECNFNKYILRWQMSKSKISPTHFCSRYCHVKYIKLKKYPKKSVNVTECIFRHYAIRWQMSKSTNVSHTFLR